MPPCDTVAKHQLPCTFCGSFKIFKISASGYGTVSMCRQMQTCTDEFLAVVHGVNKVVTWSSFCVTK